MRSECSVADCHRVLSAHGLCHMHYKRVLRHGDPLKGARVAAEPRERGTRPTAEDRFRSRVIVSESCWNWTGPVSALGYGLFSWGGRTSYAHRFAYITANGDIPGGLEVDHLCHNRRCVNPTHLEAVTHRVNVARSKGPAAQNAAKTHCKHGHALIEGNLYFRGTARICRTCHRAAIDARRSNQKRQGVA